MAAPKSHGERLDEAWMALDALRDCAVIRLAPDGIIVWANAPSARLLGQSQLKMAGVDFAALFEPGEGARLREAMARAARQGGKFSDELSLTRRDGARAWLTVEGYAADDAVQDSGMVVLCRDATEERIRRAKDERLRSLVDGLQDYAICGLSPSGVITDWNAAAERMLGYSEDEVVGSHFARLFNEEDRELDLPAAALEIARRQGSHEDEGWRMRRDGGRFWAWMVLSSLKDDAGEIIGFAHTLRDITERRVAQDALRESEQQFRLLVNGVSDYALYMLDPNGVVVNWNAGAERIKGYRANEVIGQHYSKFFTESDRAAGLPSKALYSAMEKGRHTAEGWRLRKDGALFWASVTITALRAESGDLLGFAKLTRDETERRRAQSELAKTQERLFHAQKLEALGQLTGGIAHDFNNLLMVMGGQARRLKKDRAAPDAVDHAAEMIEMAADRGAVLTRQLLSFARRQRVRRAAVSLQDRIDAFREILSKSLAANARLELDLPPGVWPVEVDPNELEVALINLAVNARDAMPDGGLVAISAENRVLKAGEIEPDLMGDFVVLRFTDTGVGIPPDVLPRIFDPFFTTKDLDKGTGLGLSQVYGFARQIGGAAVAESVLGKGTTVLLYLPRAPAQAESVSEVPESPAMGGVALVVEDNPEVAEVTADLVQQLGYRVRVAPSADAAWKAIGAGERYDLVLSDVVMAGAMNGLDLAQRLLEDHPTLPVVLVSGYPKSARSAGEEFPLVQKPFRVEELERAIARARRRQESSQPPSNVVRLTDLKRP